MMQSCAALAQSMTARRKELAILERSGKGHSLEHQDILDELGQLELQYNQQGCQAPPPPRLGHLTTTVLGPPVPIDTGSQGDILIEIQCTNDGNVDTVVEYTIDPPTAGLTQIGSWTIPVLRGYTTQQVALTIGVADTATLGARTIPIHESVIFGPVKDGAHQQYDNVEPAPSIVIGLAPPDPAYAAIETKAAALGTAFTGASTEPTQRLAWGAPTDGIAYRRRYANCTIYYSAGAGAHEIHGDIREKYDRLPKPVQLGVPAVLGIPVTDETGCPDGHGRYNHFSNQGSIYWHPETGPFAVYGAIRAAWAQAGWETGTLGYPTRDQYLPDPNETAFAIFCDFQNGVLWLDGDTGERPAISQQSSEKVMAQIWQQFNALLPAQEVRLDIGVTVVGRPGLHPETTPGAVTGNGYRFWQARNRILTVTLHGFVSLNWGLPDPTFDAQLSLLLYEDNQAHPFDNSHPPDNKVGGGDHFIYLTLAGLTVQASGLYHETVASKVSDAITAAIGPRLQVSSTDVQPPDLFAVIVARDGGIDLHHRPVLNLGTPIPAAG